MHTGNDKVIAEPEAASAGYELHRMTPQSQSGNLPSEPAAESDPVFPLS